MFIHDKRFIFYHRGAPLFTPAIKAFYFLQQLYSPFFALVIKALHFHHQVAALGAAHAAGPQTT